MKPNDSELMLDDHEHSNRAPILRAKDLWCLHKFNHCENENVANYITTCKYLFLDDLTLEMELETLKQSRDVEVE